MKKPINTNLDRLSITGQKDPDWLYSVAGRRNKKPVNDLEHLNAIGEPEYIAPIELHGLKEFETGKPWETYKPTEITMPDFSEMWDDMFRNAGKTAEKDLLEMGHIGGGSIDESKLSKKLMPTPKTAKEITDKVKVKPLSGSWLGGMLNTVSGVAAKLVSGSASGASGASNEEAAQQGGGSSEGNAGSSNTGWLIAGGIGLAAMAIIGTIIIVKSSKKGN